jgi:DNA-directed RNA polymerase subunit beta'
MDESVAKGTVICKWDPYNGVIVSEFTGKIAYEDLEQDNHSWLKL